MPKGGKRENAGRKKIGQVLNTRIDSTTIHAIDHNFTGSTRAQKIRSCLKLGLERQEALTKIPKSYYTITVKNFAKSYSKIYEIFLLSYGDKHLEIIQTINTVLKQCFYVSNDISEDLLIRLEQTNDPYNRIYSVTQLTTSLDDKDTEAVSKELSKYTWSLNESDNDKNVITPKVLGYFFEQFINKKEMGAYYTSEDITSYMCEYAVISCIISLCAHKDMIEKRMIDLLKIQADTYTKGHVSLSPSSLSSYEDIIANNVDALRLFIDTVTHEDFLYLKEVADAIHEITIIDPTVGTGAFIIIAANTLLSIFDKLDCSKHSSTKKDYVLHIFHYCLYGLDIMEDSIEILKLRIHLFLRSHGLNDFEISGITLNFKCGNTLFDPSSYSKKDLKAMYQTYGSKFKNYQLWFDACKPFDWSKEFPRVIQQGGFSCIIGNPPYVERKKSQNFYHSIDTYQTESCGNLYAYVYEKSLSLLADQGMISLIVPISIISTARMNPLLDLIKDQCDYSFFASFGDRPSTLFTGAHQKVAITFCHKNKKKGQDCQIYTSSYYHWTSEERHQLFKRMEFISSDLNKQLNTFYKIGTPIQESIMNKVLAPQQCKLESFFTKEVTKYPIYLNMRATFWCKCFTTQQPSKEYKAFYVATKKEQQILYSFFNSTLFFLIWETTSDCWHITNQIFAIIHLCMDQIYDATADSLCKLAVKLEKDLEKNKNYIGSAQTDYEYLHKKSKQLIDEIDYAFAKYYNFTEEELSYILNYHLKYRMSDEFENYLKGDHDL